MSNLDSEIADHAAGIFLRYYRPGVVVGAENASLDLARDIDLLRSHWAISEPVRIFLSYLLNHPHEAQSLLTSQRRVDDVLVRGRIDARATTLLRRVSGHPSLVVTDAPVRSFNTGPNQVVAWVVETASIYAQRLFSLQSKGSAYSHLIEVAMSAISSVKRLDALREPLKHIALARRPGPNALRDAARSRHALYRRAVSAYSVLRRMERGDSQAISTVLRSTLIGPLEQWRRFEIAVAVSIGQALSNHLKLPLRLSLLDSRPGIPILRCGKYALYWQSGGGIYKAPSPEPSEHRLKTVLDAYDLSTFVDRPDLVLIDEQDQSAIAIIEVKYLAGDTANTRFREAADQIVRYTRGFSTPATNDALIWRSLIALSQGAPTLADSFAVAPCAIDFEQIKNGLLRNWIRNRVLPASEHS